MSYAHLNMDFQDTTMTWDFNPPLAPVLGDRKESMVKLLKATMKATLGNSMSTPDQLNTFLKLSEASVNSRPIALQTCTSIFGP